MDDSSLGSRRMRPESSSSRETRMTPTSSTNSSSAHLPRTIGARAMTGTSLLQERLREKKVESARQSRRMSVDLGGRREAQSSPVKAPTAREERRPSSSGVGAGKGMGVKQIEEQVSTLHKQNFDLKLELYHRRQRQEALETRLEAAEKEISEQQDVNEQLLAELEKRDQALDEAVGIIVTLEDKVERMMQEREGVRAVDAEYESGYFREGHEISSSPPEKASRLKVNTRAVSRMPSFLSEQSEGAEALRSLYVPHIRSHSDATLPKLQEETNTDVPDSPRLSVLSESSFMSIYGDKRLLQGSVQAQEDTSSPPRTHRKSLSVEKWIEERPVRNATPSKLNRVDGIRKNGFLSINNVLESPLQKLEKLRHTLEQHSTGLAGIPERSRSVMDHRLRPEDKRRPRELLQRGFTDQSSFEHYQALPPTPDTISTSTLAHHQKSMDTLSQHADGNDQPFLNGISTYAAPSRSYDTHDSTTSLRPHSAGETITSRREGHGWDTQEELTETASQCSTTSISGYSVHAQRNGIMPPNLFTFNDLANRDEIGGWGRDMMFSNDPQLPAHKASHYDHIRHSSMVEQQRSDDTVIANNRMSQYGEQSSNQHGFTPIDISPRPDLPDRRSSLSAAAKLRKSNPNRSLNESTDRATASSPISNDKSVELKKPRIMIPRLFTRSDSTPPITFPQRPKGNGRSLSYFDGAQRDSYEVEELARATPPPIKRNRGQAVPAHRPVSAGADAIRIRRGSVFGYDGPGDDVENKRRSVNFDAGGNGQAEESTTGNKTGGQRKWLGFGRRGSIGRRN